MTKIEQLQAKVQELEESVDESWSKEDLYDVLVEAYMHLKDIIVLQQDLVPVVEDKGSETTLRDAQDQLAEALGKQGRLEATLAESQAKVLELTHWQDGANLEREKLHAKIKELDDKVALHQATIAHYMTTLNSIEQLLADAK